MKEKEVLDVYITQSDVISWTCPFCEKEVFDVKDPFPKTCKNCGTEFKMMAYLNSKSLT